MMRTYCAFPAGVASPKPNRAVLPPVSAMARTKRGGSRPYTASWSGLYSLAASTRRGAEIVSSRIAVSMWLATAGPVAAPLMSQPSPGVRLKTTDCSSAGHRELRLALVCFCAGRHLSSDPHRRGRDDHADAAGQAFHLEPGAGDRLLVIVVYDLGR